MNCFIIGGGVSLFEPGVMDKLKEQHAKGHKLFGCNHAYRHFPQLDYLIYLDTSLYVEGKSVIDNMGCQVFTRCDRAPERAQKIFLVEDFRIDNPIESGIYAGGRAGILSGIAAIDIALKMKCFEKIFLVGMDGGDFRGKVHIHHKKQKAERYKNNCHRFNVYAGQSVYNCNPESHINTFAKITLDEAIKEGGRVHSSGKSIKFQSYYGFGDQVQMRRFILEAQKKYDEVYVETPYPDILYHDTPGIKCLAPTWKIIDRLKNQKEWTEKNKDKKKLYSPELDSYSRKLRFDYGVGIRMRKQAIYFSLNEQFPICSPADLKDQDFSFPIKPYWKTKAKRILPEMPTDKRLCVIKLPSLRAEWLNKARSPLMKYFARAIDIIKKEFFIVSVADLRDGKEWLDGPLPPGIDFIAHEAEFELDALIGLLAMADLVITCPSNFTHICAVNGYPVFNIFGGYAPNYIYIDPLRPPKYGYIEPDKPCVCLDNNHNCIKEIDDVRFDATFKDFVNYLYPELDLDAGEGKRALLVSRMEHFRAAAIAETVKKHFDVVTICHTPLELYQQHENLKACYKYVNNIEDDCYKQVCALIKEHNITHAFISQVGSIQGNATARACADNRVKYAWGERFFDDRIIMDFTALQYRPDNDIYRHAAKHKGTDIIYQKAYREKQPEDIEPEALYAKYGVDKENTLVFLAQLPYDEAIKHPITEHIESYYDFIDKLLLWNKDTRILFKYHPLEKMHRKHKRYEQQYANITVCDESLNSLFNAFDCFVSFSSTTIYQGIVKGKKFATGGHHLCADDRLVYQIRRPENFSKILGKLKTRLKIDEEYLRRHLSFLTTKYTVSIEKPEFLKKLICRESFYA